MLSLRIIDKKSRKTRQSSMRTADAQSSIVNTTPTRNGMVYGGIFDFLKKKNLSDEELLDETSEYYGKTENTLTMQSYIQDMISQLTIGDDTTYDEIDPTDAALNGEEEPQSDDDYWTNAIDGEIGRVGGLDESYDPNSELYEDTSTGPQQQQVFIPFDPRLARFDAFKTTDAIYPFSDATASSVYFDLVFSIEKGVRDAINKESGNTQENGENAIEEENVEAGDRVMTNPRQAEQLLKDPDVWGTQSLMNPYCVTRLIGGLVNTGPKQFQTHMYDIRDTKRFYDSAGAQNGAIVDDAADFVSITNPTTTNIITWSNKDKWGRTPLSFQDFVFCKHWNIVPNNRLIIFRKYAAPTYDNLNFPNMVDENASPQKIYVAPIATVVSYFGNETLNKLSDLMKFTTGTVWKDLSADVHNVSGDTGDNPRAVIDRAFENGGGFPNTLGALVLQKFISRTNGLTGQYFSFGKFTGLLDRDGYQGHSQAAFDKLTSANMDPTEQIYSNRIYGPINRIKTVKKREPEIEFSQSFTLTCEYIARPIGGINTKAAMLDILANCMELASPDAVFWGGGYRFLIHPHMYPFKNGAHKNSVMDALYAGKIFGSGGALDEMFKGVKSFGEKDGMSEFEWSTVTQNIGSILSQTVGAISSLLQSVSSTLFGENNVLSKYIQMGNDAAGGDLQTGAQRLSNFLNSLNKMWKDHVIQQTAMPSISGMKALLTGEPTGLWHMTVGNPLNPIMVVGNLICSKMDVTFGDELGPDDFPIEMKVTYTIEHAMPRDKGAIQSMFNRGAGKVYKLPDWIRARTDYETKVDAFTGHGYKNGSWGEPAYMNANKLMQISGANRAGYQTMKFNNQSELLNHGNPETTFIAKFTPPDPQRATTWLTERNESFLGTNKDSRSVFFASLHTMKSLE